MALSVPPPQTTELNNKPKFDSGNLPNQNAHEAMMFSIRQGAYGGLYGLIGSTTFSLLANRFCKGIMGKGEEGFSAEGERMRGANRRDAANRGGTASEAKRRREEKGRGGREGEERRGERRGESGERVGRFDER